METLAVFTPLYAEIEFDFAITNDPINIPYSYHIGISSVPEPATWALMLLGFGGVGAALRTWRRRVSAL